MACIGERAAWHGTADESSGSHAFDKTNRWVSIRPAFREDVIDGASNTPRVCCTSGEITRVEQNASGFESIRGRK